MSSKKIKDLSEKTHQQRYYLRHLDDDGLARIGNVLKTGNVIIEKNKKKEDSYETYYKNGSLCVKMAIKE